MRSLCLLLVVTLIELYLAAAQVVHPSPPITFSPLSSNTQLSVAASSTSSHRLGGSIFTSVPPTPTLPLSSSLFSSNGTLTASGNVTSSPSNSLTGTVGTSISSGGSVPVLTSATIPIAASTAASPSTSLPSSADLHAGLNVLVVILSAFLAMYIF